MTICVTGVAGFLGSHLAEALIKQGHSVIGIDNLIGGDLDNVPEGVIFYEEDTVNLDRMNIILNAHKPEIVYHLACTAYEGFSVFSPMLCTQNTFQNTIGILTASINNNVKRFIYASSMARYGNQTPPFTEDMPTVPEDPYGVAKVAAEIVIRNLSKVHDFEYVIAVPHNIVGTRQKYNDPYRNVASIFINRMLQEKPPIIYGDGEQTRCFSFVNDCLFSLLKMMDCPSGEVYNIGGDEEDSIVISVRELAKIIACLLKFEKPFMYLPARPMEVKHAYCSSNKIRKEFGYETKAVLEDELQYMINYIKEKGIEPFKYHLPLEITTEKTPKTWTGKERM